MGYDDWTTAERQIGVKVLVAIILDCIRDALFLEIRALEDQDVDCTALWYIHDQVDKYKEWLLSNERESA